MKYKNKKKCHVRQNYITKHYSAIIGEDRENFEYKWLSHEKYRNRKIKLIKNPNPKDKRDCYIDKSKHLKNKNKFDKKKKAWSFSKKDYLKL